MSTLAKKNKQYLFSGLIFSQGQQPVHVVHQVANEEENPWIAPLIAEKKPAICEPCTVVRWDISEEYSI
jgi:hypothetical protein